MIPNPLIPKPRGPSKPLIPPKPLIQTPNSPEELGV